jgi:hypothetical protein
MGAIGRLPPVGEICKRNRTLTRASRLGIQHFCIVVLVLRRKPVHVLVLDRIAVDASTSTISLSTSTN